MSNIPRNIAGNFSDSWEYWSCGTNCLLAFGYENGFMAGGSVGCEKAFHGFLRVRKFR